MKDPQRRSQVSAVLFFFIGGKFFLEIYFPLELVPEPRLGLYMGRTWGWGWRKLEAQA